MCINCVHDDRFLIIWETFFVQSSYANAGSVVQVATALAVVLSSQWVAARQRVTPERSSSPFGCGSLDVGGMSELRCLLSGQGTCDQVTLRLIEAFCLDHVELPLALHTFNRCDDAERAADRGNRRTIAKDSRPSGRSVMKLRSTLILSNGKVLR